MKTVTRFLFLLIWCPLTMQAQTYWQRAVTNYTRQEYSSGNQNWAISQHANGWMYFANSKGLLEYDGVYWSTYPMKNETKAKAVKAEKNRILVGGLGQFGYFKPNHRGKLTYHSLSDQLKTNDVINIWNISTLGRQIFYQSDDGVFCYENNKLKFISCPHGISYSNIVYGKLYAAGNGKISILNGNRFVLLKGLQHLLQSNIVALLPFRGNILIVTQKQGLYLFDGSTAEAYSTDADVLIKRDQLTCATINSDFLALGTLQDGVILLNLKRNRADRISIAQGLQNKSVLALSLDHEYNLWVAMDNGIDYISLSAHIFFLDSHGSSIGAGYASALLDEKLYLGTNQGLYVTRVPRNWTESVVTDYISGTEGQVLCLKTYDGNVFCGGRNFFIQIGDRSITRYRLRGVWNVVPYQRNILLLGTYWGLYVMKKTNGVWRISHQIKGTGLSPKSMLVEPSTRAVWVANKEKGIYRLTLSADLTHVVSQKNLNNKQLPIKDNVNISLIDQKVVVASRQGIFVYNVAKNALEPYTPKALGEESRQSCTYFWQDQRKNIWYVTQGMLRVLRYHPENDTYYHNEDESYLGNRLIDDFENIINIQDRRYIVGTENGFAILNLQRNYHRRSIPSLQVRYLTLSGVRDSLAFTSSFEPATSPLEISYRYNSIKLEYSAGVYDKSLTVLYSYKIDGPKSEPWSSFSTDHTKEYTDLPEGNYTFSVRLQTPNGIKPVLATLKFTILPPWYRSWWAYTLYLLIMAGAGYYFVKIYRRHQRRLLMDKEQELIRQEQTFKEESNRKNQQIQHLENEKMKLELQAKSDELVRSRMNVVRKNEMLEEIKKTAIGISNSISESNIPSIRRKVVRLIGQIDTNMEHDDDMEAFQTSFDAVHHDFLTTLGKRFPKLSHKDKMLCVYIRINLLSEEIAPLLNISVRGVEISRYRLRKKLELEDGENLTDFLQRLTE